MAFPEGYLNEGEELVLNLKPHWWVFAQPVALVVGALAVAVALTVAVDVIYLPWLGWALVVVALVNLLIAYSRWSSTAFVLTSDRLIFRHGVVTKRGVELPLDRINNINFGQSLFERMIGAGDLLIESAGESGQSRFSNVRKPSAVQNEINRQMDHQRGRYSGGGRPVEESAAEKIRQLEELRSRGLVSDEEFEAKRRELLDRM